jgi:radical SAM protein with 4Fe4S-binding SPASM domain
MKRWIGVNPNGDIYPCGRVMDIDPYANVNDLSDIREIYNSKSYLSLLRGAIIRRKKCQ